MAALIQHKSGLFYIQFSDKTQRPQKKRISLKTKRRRTAEQLKARLERDYLLGNFDPWAPADEADEQGPDLRHLGDAADAYLASCTHLKSSTQKTYCDIILPFVEHVGRERLLSTLTPRHVLDWLDATSAADVTRRKYTHHLGYLFRFLVRRGWMEKDVSKDVPLRKVPEKAPKSMTREQVEHLVNVILKYEAPRQADFTWLARLIWLNVHVGLRRGELIHLRWEHIDLERRVLRVVNSEEFTTKSSKERAIPLCEKALEVLRELRQEGHEGYVFQLRGEKLSHNTLTQYFWRFRRRAGLPEHINLHGTRHTFATWLAENGVPVGVIKELMGHSSITTTERYMRVRPSTTRHWVERAFEPSHPQQKCKLSGSAF